MRGVGSTMGDFPPSFGSLVATCLSTSWGLETTTVGTGVLEFDRCMSRIEDCMFNTSVEPLVGSRVVCQARWLSVEAPGV